MRYDLEDRTAKFGEEIIKFCKKSPKNAITLPIVSQLIRSGTSIGANYREADCAESRKDFEHKIGICKKEANESKYWLEMFKCATPELLSEIRPLSAEAKELQLIFVAIVKKSRLNAISAKH